MTLLKRIPLKKTVESPILRHPNSLFIFWLCFAIIGLFGVLHHAMWRDELNGWLIARDSESLRQFLYNIRYEGHPVLWYSLLAILNQVTHNPVIMQVFHWFLALSSISIFILFSPFSKLQKTLFIFGYLPFYEYQVISRNYALGMLCLLLVCTLWQTRRKTYLWLGLVLALMANTNAYCLLISGAFAAALGIEALFFKRNIIINKINFIISGCIYLLGVAGSVIMLFPPSDSNLQGGASQWFFQFDLYRLCQTLSRIWNSYVLILVPKDSNFLDVAIFSVLSLGLIAFVITLLRRKPVVLLFYFTGSGTILLFTYLKFLGSARHYGHLYLVLIAALWIGSYYPKTQAIFTIFQGDHSWLSAWKTFVRKQQKSFIIMLLFFQIIAGIVAFSRDLSIPYSASRATASYIKEKQLENKVIVGSEDFTLAPVAAYLNKKIYYPESQSLGSYVLFNHQRTPVNDEEIIRQIQTMLKHPNESILLILNHPLAITETQLQITPIKEFTNGFIYNEKYYLYEVSLSPI
ncbi:MAG: hypothetical protein AB4041_03505 [Microcystaceae cyanobacterium]